MEFTIRLSNIEKGVIEKLSKKYSIGGIDEDVLKKDFYISLGSVRINYYNNGVINIEMDESFTIKTLLSIFNIIQDIVELFEDPVIIVDGKEYLGKKDIKTTCNNNRSE